MIDGLSPLLATGAPSAGRDDPRKIQEAAGDFEALLIASLLKSMREAGSSGWLGGGEDKASEPLIEIAEQQLARLMAAQGGLGLARLVSQGLVSQGLVSQGLSHPGPQTVETKAPTGR